MKVYLASDHAGFELKQALVDFIRELGHEVEDLGPQELNETDDYPDFIGPMAHRVAGESESFGVAIGGSGEGEAMAANRVEGVRAAEYYGGNLDIVRVAREHNDANILSLGARFVSEDEAKDAVKLFLDTPFSNDERHVRRIDKLDHE
jgi:ribose 5-phosphate isomerase B